MHEIIKQILNFTQIAWFLTSEHFGNSTYMDDNTLVKQTLFLGSHDKVMRVVPVVHDVLQIDTCDKSNSFNMTATLKMHQEENPLE